MLRFLNRMVFVIVALPIALLALGCHMLWDCIGVAWLAGKDLADDVFKFTWAKKE